MRLAITTICLSLILLLTLGGAVSSQEIDQGRYTLDGDEVFIEVDETDARHLYAVGNVRLTFSLGGDDWTLSAGRIEFVESLNEAGEPLQRSAYAEENLHVAGSDVSLTAPGSLTVDLLERHLYSDSPDIHVTYPDGSLITDALEIIDTTVPDGPDTLIVNTSERTVATYNLSASTLGPAFEEDDSSSGSVFGALKFDFSTITVETERTISLVTEGKLTRVGCPDPTVITSGANTLSMPSCELLFDPTMLIGNAGVELGIGENTRLAAGTLRLSYPPDGGMYAEFAGCAPGDPAYPAYPELVTITHPEGTFSAGTISIRINTDGTHRIHASGNACFEVPLSLIQPMSNPMPDHQ